MSSKKAVKKRTPWDIVHTQKESKVFEKFIKDEAQPLFGVYESKTLACTVCKVAGQKVPMHKKKEQRWKCKRRRCERHPDECTFVLKVSLNI